MATTLDIIRKLTLRAKAENFDETERSVKSLGEAYETSARRQLSVEKSLQNLERRFITGAKAQQDFEKVQRQVNAVIEQNPALQARANAVLAEAHKHLMNAGQSGGVLAKQFALLNAEAQGLAGSLGRVAPFLLALGPAGLAAGAALGILATGFGLAASEAIKLADTAGKLKDLSDTTGFTVTQLQALEQAGAKVGLSAEQVTAILERFTVQFDELQTGAGGLYKALAAIDPVLAQQAARAGSLAQAWDIVSKAIAKADESQRAALSKQAYGRGGVSGSRLNLATFDAGGINAAEAALNKLDVITLKQAEHWDDLGDRIAENTKIARQNIVSTFASPTLESMEKVTAELRVMSQVIKGTDWSSGWGAWASAATGAIASVIPGLNVIVSGMKLMKSLTATAPVAEGAGPGRFEQVFGDLDAMQSTVDKLAALRKAHQDAKAETIRNAEASKQYIQALSGTATPAEELKNKIIQLNAQVAKGEVTSGQAAIATKRLNDEFRLNQAKGAVSALGSAATVAEQYALKVKELSAQLARGEINQQTFNRAVAGLDLERTVQFMQANVSALGEAATGTEKYEAKVAQLSQQLSKGEISQDAFTRSVRQLNPAFKAVQDAISEVGSAMASAFIDGANAAEALNRSLKAVASTAASSAINNLIKGDFGGAAVSAGIGFAAFIGSKLFGGQSQEEKDAEAAADAKRIQDRQRDLDEGWSLFMRRVQASIKDASTLQAQLTLFDAQADAQRRDEQAAGGRKMAELEQTLADERLKIIEEFNAQVLARQQTFQDRAFAASTDTSTLEGALAAFDRAANQERAAEAKLGGDAMADLEQALAAERLKIQNDFAAQALAAAEEQAANQIKNAEEVTAAQKQLFEDSQRVIDGIISRAATLNDRLFAANVHGYGQDDTLTGQLALFDRAAMREREEEIRQGGENIALLEQVQQQERLNLINDYNARILEEQKQAQDELARQQQQALEEQQRAEQERVDAIKKANEDIIAYLNGLLTSNLSPLSAKAQLDEARRLYEAQLALAQSGDLTALQDITRSADTLLNASKAFYGSSQGYQRDFQAIQGQLGSLAGGNAGTLSPANDNVAAISAAGFASVTTLLGRLVELVEKGNEISGEIPNAIYDQTTSINQEARFSDRKAGNA